jgi:nitroreductase
VTILDERTAVTAVPLHPVLADRWSTRAYDGSPVDDSALTALLEAARWAPSAMNAQPWRFLVGRRGTEGPDSTWQAIYSSLAEGNRIWADRASVLIVATARTRNPDGTARAVGPYELGLAVAQLSMQAHADGLHVHQMGGFDPDVVRSALGVPGDYTPYVVLAVGRRGSDDHLPQFLREREGGPRERLPLRDIAFAGTWGDPADLR